MKELYFINLIGNLNTAAWVIFGVLCFDAWIIGIAYFMGDVEEALAKKLFKPMMVVSAICLVLGIMLPTKKDAYIIYGIGSVVDYIQENDEARQLPDKTVKMLNATMAEKYNQTKEEEQ